MATVTPVGTPGPTPNLDEHGIRETLVKMFNQLAQVRVITVVGKASVALPSDGEARASVDTDQATLNDAIVTIFNLIDGDVTNVIAPSLKDDQAMREFHASQVEKSLAVLPTNIAAVVQFGKELISLLRS